LRQLCHFFPEMWSKLGSKPDWPVFGPTAEEGGMARTESKSAHLKADGSTRRLYDGRGLLASDARQSHISNWQSA
jgi:hypothetical protein